MRRMVQLLTGLTVLSVAMAGVDPVLDRATKARQDGLPQVVVFDLKSALASEPPGPSRTRLAVELARCLIDADRPREAIQHLEEPEFATDAEAQFWLAQALAEAGEIELACVKYEAIGAIPGFSLAAAARLGQARMLEALGRRSEAASVLRSLASTPAAPVQTALELCRVYVMDGKYAEAMAVLDRLPELSGTDRESAMFFEARIALDLGNAGRALELFDSGLAATDPGVRSGSLIGSADALVSLGRPADAEQRLESAIDQSPNDARLGDIFAKLDEIYAANPEASGPDLRRWARDRDHPGRAAFASFYQAWQDFRTGRRDQALKAFRQFAEREKNHPLRSRAMAEAVQILLDADRPDEALAVLSVTNELAADDPMRVDLQFLLGNVYLAINRASAARAMFLSVARRSEALEPTARDNAALAEAMGGEVPASALPGSEGRISERAALTRALIAARDLRDDGPLRSLARTARNPATRAQATFATAELAWAEGRDEDARIQFQRIVNDPGLPAADAEAFAVFVSDDGTDAGNAKVIREARAYLRIHPESPRAPEVRMKLAEVLARTGDHRGAWIEFELAARDATDPSIRGAAWFFAAQSAARSMDAQGAEQAILLYEEVVRDGGPLAGRARFEQALLQNALGRPGDAKVLLDRLIAETNDPELKTSARMEMGDTLFSEQTPENLKQAIAVWMAVAGETGVAAADRNEALTKAAAAHERSKEWDAALSRYYQVIESPASNEPEFFWYYKAGFDAARLLESQGRWQEAMVVYEKLAASNGPRSSEAESRVKRLRLENFIWE